MIRAYLDEISDALGKGKSVALLRIGVLQPYLRQGRRYRHPTTGEEGVSADRPDVRFIVTPLMKTALSEMPADALEKLTQS